MAIIHSPSIPTNGLVYSCDPANPRSFDSRENRLLYSTDITNGVWGSNGAAPTKVLNAIQAPDGTFTGASVSAGNSLLQDITIAGNVPLTCSMYIKSTTNASFSLAIWRIGGSSGNGNVTISFNPVTGAAGTTNNANMIVYSFSMISVGDGWWRVSISGVSTDASHTSVRFELYQGGAYFIWGPQVEVARLPTGTVTPPYVPTTATAVTRPTTISDLSGATNAGTLTNNPYYSTNGYGSLLFNGTSAYTSIATPPLAAGAANYTLCVWFYCLQNTVIGTIYEQNSATILTSQRSALLQYGGSWGFNGESNDRATTTVRVNTWVMGTIVIEKDDPTYPCRVYEYNNLSFAGPTTVNPASSLNVGTSGAGLGRKISSNSEFFNGFIGNVFIYNRSLSQPEINQIYQATRGRYGI